MILFFDTETTGLPNDRLRPDHPDQPHLVQLAALLTETDGRARASLNLIVNAGQPIPEGAAKIHGLTTAIVTACGVPLKTACQTFSDLMGKADMLVAHNLRFDVAIMETAYLRLGGRPARRPSGRACTMEAASSIMKLPPTPRMVAAGFNKPKPPKLEECIRHFFGEELIGAHDALADVRACARVFFHLRSLGAFA